MNMDTISFIFHLLANFMEHVNSTELEHENIAESGFVSVKNKNMIIAYATAIAKTNHPGQR